VNKIIGRAELVREVARRRAAGERIVFTNGCFDLLHPGHITLLERARDMGDVLIVGVNSDRSVRELKGPSRPLLPEQERVEVLAGLAAVDYVTIFDEPTPRELVAAVLPDVLLKGADWGAYIVGREDVEARGGQVISAELEPGWSTSGIIKTVHDRFAPKPATGKNDRD
jgi:rfaE bifunctional protein nucleotidyltransferase chain/domain